jgi:hypothetical protein
MKDEEEGGKAGRREGLKEGVKAGRLRVEG